MSKPINTSICLVPLFLLATASWTPASAASLPQTADDLSGKEDSIRHNSATTAETIFGKRDHDQAGDRHKNSDRSDAKHERGDWDKHHKDRHKDRGKDKDDIVTTPDTHGVPKTPDTPDAMPTPSAVPVPAAAWLLASGIIGLGLGRIRRG